MQQKKGYHRIPVCPINRKWSRNACREGEGRGEGGRRIVEVVPKGASYRTYILYSVSKLVHSRLIRFEFPSCAALIILWIMRVTRSKRRKRKNSSNFQRSLFIRIWIKGETRWLNERFEIGETVVALSGDEIFRDDKTISVSARG